MSTVYSVPDSPPDPESAALELIVRLPELNLAHDAFRPVLQDYAGALTSRACLPACRGSREADRGRGFRSIYLA